MGCKEIEDVVEDSPAADSLLVMCFVIIDWQCKKESYGKYTTEEGIHIVTKEEHSPKQDLSNETFELAGITTPSRPVQPKKASLPI
mmetsp:Transcript_46190/g.111962  ORF Transcript_46190/g.111962 Transcript_46190/m.111962 type:complete len:86 (+) Transcript_46190:1122-1379(+)